MAHPNTPAVDLTGHGTLDRIFNSTGSDVKKKRGNLGLRCSEEATGSGMCGHDELKMSKTMSETTKMTGNGKHLCIEDNCLSIVMIAGLSSSTVFFHYL